MKLGARVRGIPGENLKDRMTMLPERSNHHLGQGSPRNRREQTRLYGEIRRCAACAVGDVLSVLANFRDVAAELMAEEGSCVAALLVPVQFADAGDPDLDDGAVQRTDGIGEDSGSNKAPFFSRTVFQTRWSLRIRMVCFWRNRNLCLFHNHPVASPCLCFVKGRIRALEEIVFRVGGR